MRYNEEGRQEFIMEVPTPHGKERLRSIRICNDKTFSINYFQPEPPKVVKFHGGSWILHSVAEGTRVIAQHQIVINPETCLAVFGEGTVTDYKEKITTAIEKNGAQTLEICAKHLSN
jgi:aromatase